MTNAIDAAAAAAVRMFLRHWLCKGDDDDVNKLQAHVASALNSRQTAVNIQVTHPNCNNRC